MRYARRCVLAILVLVLFGAALDRIFPPPRPDPSRHAVVVAARDGTPLRAFPDRHHLWRQSVRLDDVSPRYLEALVAYEDRMFWWHPGFNPVALMRAAVQRVRHGRIVSGGSTLTMQVARILEPIPRTVPGKVKQILRAVQLELRYSKREILGLYADYAPMGGVFEGVEAASRAYLGKSAARLTHAEAALLAVLPQAPSLLRPDRNPAKARAARDKVLRRMHAHWDAATIADAMKEPAYSPAAKQPLAAPLLAERLRNARPGHARIETTIDATAQSTVERLLLDRLAQLPPRVSLAAIVIHNESLEVRAYAGSADFGDDERAGHVDMVRASRSPGSALKPFLYALALDDGLIHSESLLADVPQSFSGYQPANFQQSFHGPISVSEALTLSLNVPAVEVLEHLGPTRFLTLLRRGGLSLELPRGANPNLSIILGGAGASLESLTAAYTAFARGGVAGKPRFTPDDPLHESRMMSDGAAYIVRAILAGGSPVNRAMNDDSLARASLAIKTGTSFGYRDAWAIGVGERYTIGVWIGRPDGTPNPGYFGANVAAPLVTDIAATLASDPLPAPRLVPPSVTQANICWPLGVRDIALADDYCHVKRRAWILNDTAPPTFADKLHGGEARSTYYVRAGSGLRASTDCTHDVLIARDTARWPTKLEAWLDTALRAKALPPAWDPACRRHARTDAAIQIVGATDGMIISRAGNGAPLVRLEVRGHQGDAHWLVNGQRIAHTPPGGHYIHRFATPGRYEITAFENGGRYDRISVSVR